MKLRSTEDRPGLLLLAILSVMLVGSLICLCLAPHNRPAPQERPPTMEMTR